MNSKNKSRFTTAFKAGVKSGKSCSSVVNTIAQKNGISTGTVYQSLYNCGMCYRQKFNGTWLYWPTFACKANTTACTTMQTTMWQCFVDWCCATGNTTPAKLNSHSTSQKNFMNFCKKFLGKQTTGKTMTKTTTAKATKTKSKNKNSHKFTAKTLTTKGKKRTTGTTWTNVRNYKFPTNKTKTTTRRYSKVA